MVRIYRQQVEQPTHATIYTARGERNEVRTFANGDEEHHVEIVTEPTAAEQEQMGVRPVFDHLT